MQLFWMSAFASLCFLFSLGVKAQSTQWVVKKTEWSAVDERNYEEFIMRLGEAVEKRQCRTVRDCLKSVANPYRNSDPSNLNLFADCADFPYFIRAYFAWKNNLPFSLAVAMAPRNVDGNSSSDIRYSKYGNRVVQRLDVAKTNLNFNAVGFFNQTVVNQVSSANFRVHAQEGDGPLFSDHYPIAISREAVRPGSVVYDPNGHVAVIYRVGDDGRVHFIDAHPDNSLTYGIFGKQFQRSNPGHGAGFRSWRPIRVVDAKRDAQGNVVAGQIAAARNAELPLYSLVQIYGTHPDPQGRWSAGPFIVENQTLDYYEYVRVQMAAGRLVIKPEEELRGLLHEICNAVSDRVIAVDQSIKANIQDKAHPVRLPKNIYGTEGEWETYSTPSRDARMKVIFKDVLDRTRTMLEKHRQGADSIAYSGVDLPGDLLRVYEKESRACQITYTNTAERAVTLSLEDVRQRLFLLSFDPYHCVELRWGASSPEELASCRDDANKRLWYMREQYLRNQLDRTYDAKMDFTVDELATLQPGNGVAEAPDTDVVRYLKTLK